MAEKQRQLPSWMALQGGVKEKAPTSTTSRELAGRTVFYCMNEKELVEAAISYLTDDVTGGVHAPLRTDQQVIDSVTSRDLNTVDGFTGKRRRVCELEAVEEASGDSSERTCVSETDLDETEEETLPYAPHLRERQGVKGPGSGPEQGPGPGQGLGSGLGQGPGSEPSWSEPEQGPGAEQGPESGPEQGPESGPEQGPESGPEPGPESGPEQGSGAVVPRQDAERPEDCSQSPSTTADADAMRLVREIFFS